MLFHENILILFILVIGKLEIPNSKKEKVNKNPGCTAIILHGLTILGSMLSFVNEVAEFSKQTEHMRPDAWLCL